MQREKEGVCVGGECVEELRVERAQNDDHLSVPGRDSPALPPSISRSPHPCPPARPPAAPNFGRTENAGIATVLAIAAPKTIIATRCTHKRGERERSVRPRFRGLHGTGAVQPKGVRGRPSVAGGSFVGFGCFARFRAEVGRWSTAVWSQCGGRRQVRR
jgi:hypothetical protein